MGDSLAERLKREVTPLIDQDKVTFVWRGKTAPVLVGDFTGWEDGKSIPLEKHGRGIWICQLSFPPDAYIEYSYIMDSESLEDPLNPRITSNGVGGYNSFFSMPGHKSSGFAKYNHQVAHGSLAHHYLPTKYLLSGSQRSIHLYQPPGDEAVPLVVAWDGQDYLKRMHLNNIVDNLIALGRIRPIALAFVNNGGQVSRAIEYACNDATIAWLVSEVLPLAKKELNLIDIDANPGQFAVLGASMGGLMALYTAARLPSIFGKVLSQSGAFTLGSFDTVVFDLLGQGQNRPLDIWLDVGRYDLAGLLESNRRLQSLLLQRKYSLTYREYNAGHNTPAWKDELWRGLVALFGVQK